MTNTIIQNNFQTARNTILTVTKKNPHRTTSYVKACHTNWNYDRKIILGNFTYLSVVLIVIQSLWEQGQTKEANMQKAEDSGGCVLPGETTQPNAT
jgi:hypothetical protein